MILSIWEGDQNPKPKAKPKKHEDKSIKIVSKLGIIKCKDSSNGEVNNFSGVQNDIKK